ncbi:MAG: response regulator [Bacteroidetes bacterium]|nr:response regulator [Bacteroidota bacterium]
MKVLIIDDETDICYLLSTLLKQKNLDAEYVNTLSEAAVALKKDTPGIIFLDNHLPDGLGMNFIEYIKLHYPASKIIMITAHDTDADRQRALKGGADYFIGKPFTKDIVYKAVDQVLN